MTKIDNPNLADEALLKPVSSEYPIGHPEKAPDAESGTKKGGLARTIGLFDSIGIIIGCIIGSGIFVSPAGVQREAGSIGMSLAIWSVAGIFVMFGSFCYIELGLTIRQSGGDYAYINHVFGSFIGFIRLWIEAVVVRPCTCTIVAITFAVYTTSPFFPEGPDPTVVCILAAIMIVFLTGLNAVSIRASVFLQNVCTFGKVGALIVIIGFGLFNLATSEASRANFDNAFEGSNTNPGAIAVSFYSALFAYQGWNYLNFIIEEVIDPAHVLPKAITISTVAVTIIYVLTNVAFYTVLSPSEMLASSAAAIEYAERTTGYTAAGVLVSILVGVSCFGSGNGVIYTSSRLFLVGARNNHMPKFFLMTNPEMRTPIPAVVMTGLLSLAYLALSNNVITLINYIAISYWLAIGTASGAIFYLRRVIPKSERPFTVWTPIVAVFTLGCIFLVVFPFFDKPLDAFIGLLIVATAVPVYYLFIVKRPDVFNTLADKLTFIVQAIFLVKDEHKDDTTADAQELEDKSDEKNGALKAALDDEEESTEPIKTL